MINELVDYFMRHMKECLKVKVDFEKASDCVPWDYLRYIMRRTSFSNKWLDWMKALVFNSSMSILVNGIPLGDFQVIRGLG